MTDVQPSTGGGPQLSREQIYREWLGISYANPTYYGLLGVPELENDSIAILHAGRRVKRKLRAYQIGTYRQQALDLLSDIGQAVSVLTNAEKKRAYDRELFTRWRKDIEDLYRRHCEGKPCDAAVLEAWLRACATGGVPVARLLPVIIRSLGSRLQEWPAHGDHRVGLPVNLWLYRDAVILGQCLHIGSLERRAETVKSVQKILGVSEDLARLMAEGVTRASHLFGETWLSEQAKDSPRAFLVRMGRRIRRYGGRLGRHGTVLAMLAVLVGMNKKSLEEVFERLADAKRQPTAAEAAEEARKRLRQGLRHFHRRAARFFGVPPQVLVIGAAVAAGVAALVVALLVAGGVWQPWSTAGTLPAALPPIEEKEPVPVLPPPPPVVSHIPSPALLPLPSAKPDDAELEALREFIKKYPSGKVTNLPPPGTQEDPVGPAPGPGPGKTRTGNGKAPTTFFSVPAERAPDKKEKKHVPSKTSSPTPKPPEPAPPPAANEAAPVLTPAPDSAPAAGARPANGAVLPPPSPDGATSATAPSATGQGPEPAPPVPGVSGTASAPSPAPPEATGSVPATAVETTAPTPVPETPAPTSTKPPPPKPPPLPGRSTIPSPRPKTSTTPESGSKAMSTTGR
jgi:hypothetical protein